MSERFPENSGSSSASNGEQPHYGQYSADRGQASAAGQDRYGQDSSAQGTGQEGYGTAGYGDSASSGSQHGGSGYGGYGDSQYGADGQYGHQTGGGHGYSGQQYGVQNPGHQGYGGQQYGTQGYGPQGYGAQQGYDSQNSGGYPTHYQDGYAQQPYGQQPYNGQDPYGQSTAPSPGKGLAIASLVLGILGILTFWFGGLGGLIGLVGLVLGIVGLVKIRKARRESPALAVVGVVLSSLAVIGGILMAVVFAWAFSSVSDCMEYASQGDEAKYEQCLTDSLEGNTPNT